MRKYYFIAAGGAVGALLRFKLKNRSQLIVIFRSFIKFLL